MYLKFAYLAAVSWEYDFKVLSRLIYILMVKASNSYHNTPRKEEFHSRLRGIHISVVVQLLFYVDPRYYK